MVVVILDMVVVILVVVIVVVILVAVTVVTPWSCGKSRPIHCRLHTVEQ